MVSYFYQLMELYWKESTMKRLTILMLVFLPLFLISPTSASATTVNLSFAKLTGITGGSPAGTAVYKASLDGLGLSSIQSITIADNSFGLGGSPGQFSGFDLDAIVLSTTSITSALSTGTLSLLDVFDYGSAIFSPGTQRAPLDPKLFGTGISGNTVDNLVATLGLFDGNSTTAIPGADGFISMGDGGVLSFNLSSLVSTTGLYLYIGEVGDNGEVASGNISISDRPVNPVPEPSTFVLLGAGLAGLAAMGIRRRKS